MLQEKIQAAVSLQEAMRRVVKGVGGFDHAQWRAFNNPQRTEAAKNFIDGDLIEQFLDLR
jgi:DNA damage-binding protein 1